MRAHDPAPAQDGTETLSLLRRRTYLLILPVTLVAATVIFLLSHGEPGSTFNSLALPVLAAGTLALLLGLVSGRVPLRWTEQGFYALAVLAFLTKYLSSVLDHSVPPDSALAELFIWTPFVYLLAFLIESPRRALIRSAAVYGVSVLIGVYGVWTGGMTAARLLEYHLAEGIILTLVSVLSALKDQVLALQDRVGDLHRLAHLDPLTGISNRRQLELQLSHEVLRSKRYGTPWCVILFDLDDFKTVNDRHGHVVGDEVLRQAAAVMQREVRGTDLLGRWGGEEFLILAVQIDLPYALALTERLRVALERHVMPGAGHITASFGVAAYRDDETSEQLIARADAALYAAKNAGKNRVEGALVKVDTPLRVPALRNPFPVAPPTPHHAVAQATSRWLSTFELGPQDDVSRVNFAGAFAQLAAALHPGADPDALRLMADWYSVMFLHDDRCDASGIGKDPPRLRVLTSRLLAALRGQPPLPDDEPLAWAIADLSRRLRDAGGDAWLHELAAHVTAYFGSLAWEADNRARGVVPALDEYVRMRPLTAGLAIDEAFLSLVDHLRLPGDAQAHPAVHALTQHANRAVCWSNDIISLEKELQGGDVHNLVLVLRQERGLGLQDALEAAAAMYHQELERLIAVEQHLPDLGPEVNPALARYVQLQQVRVGGILEWSWRSKRYQLGSAAGVPG
ncbi:diguanylate cyclase (GGDEF)-like protein [Deinococcus metalli]|uniref:Diguanylate cyclase (GGDEF)-like protein n=1 Tax=Deinococcus metalli TaxID=1141878 RepID=A0A7W8KER6_9DEIO|nr:diguanylate cyclase [Deinococcus metalli]MBB5375676.1 diguanylate cyclase (GGDEF)-like protein [Deinococcus metalli]